MSRADKHFVRMDRPAHAYVALRLSGARNKLEEPRPGRKNAGYPLLQERRRRESPALFASTGHEAGRGVCGRRLLERRTRGHLHRSVLARRAKRPVRLGEGLDP